MIVPEGREDLDKVDKYFLSDDSPDDCMMLSDLDGFLTGIACGPEAISPAEWMPVVWGEEPNFHDEAQRLEMESAILKMYDSILETLKDGEWAISPVFWRTVDGVDIVSDWCEGFLEAIHLRIDAWKPIFTHRTHGDLLLPILIHCMTPDGDDYFPSAFTDNEPFMEQMPKLIPDAVHGVYRFWRDEALRPEPIKSAAKVGRNDPCSCGSGKKFKRCCGG